MLHEKSCPRPITAILSLRRSIKSSSLVESPDNNGSSIGFPFSTIMGDEVLLGLSVPSTESEMAGGGGAMVIGTE
jgi:hypothetical protein